MNPRVDEYEAWMRRVRATYEALTYTCWHRLGDHQLAEQVSVQVIAGLVARPRVFRYYGLPYSGRIARLAEDKIAEAQQGRLAAVEPWSKLSSTLAELPSLYRRVFLLTCVFDHDDTELAAALGCDYETAGSRRAEIMALMEEIAAPHLSIVAPPE
jgi:hypothetical protein